MQSAESTEAQQRGTRRTLLEVLEALLRLLHPLMPFITEEIWLQVAPLAGKSGETIMLQPFPRATDFALDESSARDVDFVRELILKLRNIRGENDIPSSRRLEHVFIKDALPEQLAIVQAHRSYFDRLANAELQPFDSSCDVDVAASARVGNLEIYVPLRGLKENLAAETARLAKLQERARKELAASRREADEPRIRAQCTCRGYGQDPGASRRVAAGALAIGHPDREAGKTEMNVGVPGPDCAILAASP